MSDWSAKGTKKERVSSPKAKFLQWRAILKSSASSPGSVSLNEVSVSYLAGNIAPEVLSIQILPTNVGLLANPPVQIDPNIENSGLDPTVFGLPPVTNIPPRRVYQRGARALQWTAEDRNGDRSNIPFITAKRAKIISKCCAKICAKLLHARRRGAGDGRYIFKIAAKIRLQTISQSLAAKKSANPLILITLANGFGSRNTAKSPVTARV